MSDTELACAELVELVTAFLEGGLDHETRARFEEHLAVCDGCRNYLDQIATTIGIAGRVRVDDLSDETKAGLLEAFRDLSRDGSQGGPT